MKCNHLDHFFDRQFIGDVWWIPVVSKVSRKSDISITFKSDDDDEVNFNVLCCCWECFFTFYVCVFEMRMSFDLRLNR